MLQLQALIFDVDGTLAETERDGHRVAFNRAFAEAGLDWQWSIERYGELLEVAGGKERIRAFIEQDCPALPEGSQDVTALCETLHQAKNQCYQQMLDSVPLRPGVARLLHKARSQGIRLAIATTSALDNVIALLETALAPDAASWFEVIAAGDMVAAKKPAPDIYQYALEAMRLAPEYCLAIEDSHQGLQAATQAGLTTVITMNDYTRHHDFAKAALVLNHLGEPGTPCTVISGDAQRATYFDLDIANELLLQRCISQLNARSQSRNINSAA